MYSAIPLAYEIQSIFIEHLIRHQETTHSFQMFIEHRPRQILSWAIRQTSTNLKELKLYSVFSDPNETFQINNLTSHLRNVEKELNKSKENSKHKSRNQSN